MAFQSESNPDKKFGSKFRQSRYDRENSNPEAGPRSEANKLEGKNGQPNVENRLHNNPHPEKFNTPLNGPKPAADGQEMGEEQSEAHEAHSVVCPQCGADVPVKGSGGHDDNPAGMSETEEAVHDGKEAKGVWPDGQREHPDAENVPDRDDFDPILT